MCLGTNYLPSGENGQLHLVFWAGISRVVVSSNFDGQLGHSVKKVVYFFRTLGNIFSKAI
jgi:argonaute-like protein implicated in RNA metabolism and viral defense